MTNINSVYSSQYTPREEFFNSLSHGLGILLGILTLLIMIPLSEKTESVFAVISVIVFGFSIVFMYTSSTLYHAFSTEKAKRILKKLDHISIYYLIAGTYTPFILIKLRDTAGISILATVWGLAILGTFLKIKFGGSGTKFWSIALYLLMGWNIILISKKLFAVLPEISSSLLLLGGLLYTLGILFYIQKKKKYMHAVWHCFVLAGTSAHFFSIMNLL